MSNDRNAAVRTGTRYAVAVLLTVFALFARYLMTPELAVAYFWPDHFAGNGRPA